MHITFHFNPEDNSFDAADDAPKSIAVFFDGVMATHAQLDAVLQVLNSMPESIAGSVKDILATQHLKDQKSK